MTENEAMTLLADANPVRVEDLTPLNFPDLPSRRRPARRLVVAVALLLAAVAAALTGVFAFGWESKKPLVEPAVPPGFQPLADASRILGAPVVLPDTTLVRPSDADRTVETVCVPKDDTSAPSGPGCQVRVSFPSAGLTVTYLRFQSMQSLRTSYEQIVQHDSGAQLVSVSGVQALWVPQQQESWIEFDIGGTDVSVQGSFDEATLEGIAQSIIDRTTVQPSEESAGIGPVPWSHPPGTQIDSLEDAASHLPFQPVAPTGLGSPGIFAGDELTLVYDNPAGGKYWVVERPSGATTTAVLREIAKECTPAGGCKGTDTMVPLAGGNEGLLLEGASTTGVIWVERGIYFDVFGPAATFTAQQAQSVAESVIAVAG